MVIVYQAPFISINKLKHRLDLRPGNHGSFFFSLSSVSESSSFQPRFRMNSFHI